MPSTPPFQSKLIPYQEKIMHMWHTERITLKTIQAWLAEQNVTITLSGLSAFIRRQKAGIDPHERSQVTKQTSTKVQRSQAALDALEKLMKR